MMMENPDFLTKQLTTYIGNKRMLLDFIGSALEEIKMDLGFDKLSICDAFSGSGATARFFKAHASRLVVNDLENYVEVLNRCYLANKSQIDFPILSNEFEKFSHHMELPLDKGFISRLYAPLDDTDIKKGERVFFTTRNANYIDTARKYIDSIEKDLQPFFTAPLICEASVKSNTSGVFKGFYKNSTTGVGQFGGNGKNALSRIMSDIKVNMPIFSNFDCDVEIYKQDANKISSEIDKVDLMYIDPPYNQHPYGSNYFMLNLICDYKEPCTISHVSGIPKNWNRSEYNSLKRAKNALYSLCENANAKYLLISFNSDGFIKKEEMESLLSQIGKIRTFTQKYNTFRGSRNLNERAIHINEYLYLLKKN